MFNSKAYDRALEVEVYDGEVVLRAIDGPTGVSLTPRAAAETAAKLTKAALEAEQHRAQENQASQGAASPE